MMNFTGGYNYNQYNPYLTPQQRLNQLEAQYPQFTQNPMPQQNTGFKTIPVSNADEANATQADLSGNPIFFFNKAKGEIYLKQLNLQDGSAIFQTFKLTATPAVNENTPQGVILSERQYKALNDKLDALYSMLANKEPEPLKKEVRSNVK